MKTNILKQFLFLSLICIIWSCSKKDSNETKTNPSVNGKLQYMILSSNDTMEFLYDNSGRLITFYWRYGGTNTKGVYSYIRNSVGQITRYIYEEPSYDFKQTYDYSINSAGKYISTIVTKVDAGNTSNSSEAYTYTGNQITKIDQSQSGHLVQTNVLTYDSRGNVSKQEKYNGSGVLESKTESTFDNNAHPVGMPGAPIPMTIFFIFGINNCLSTKTTNQNSVETITASYSFDNSGKPISAIFSGGVEGGTMLIKYKYY
jgi:hypothetical protein